MAENLFIITYLNEIIFTIDHSFVGFDFIGQIDLIDH